MENSTGASRLIPEQVWDTTDIPERELIAGKGSGSACPLVWAHSEYIKATPVARRRKDFRPATANGGTLFNQKDIGAVLQLAL